MLDQQPIDVSLATDYGRRIFTVGRACGKSAMLFNTMLGIAKRLALGTTLIYITPEGTFTQNYEEDDNGSQNPIWPFVRSDWRRIDAGTDEVRGSD